MPPSDADLLRVPRPGYEAQVLYRWGDPVGIPAAMPAFRMDASNSAADQAVQAGMHHDGMHFFPLPQGGKGSAHGLLAINHEYLDEGLLFTDGQKTSSAEKGLKSQNAVGKLTVIEVRLEGGQWQVVRPSWYARRITARTPCRISGPAAGHALMRTAADPEGRNALGTYNGCAHGWTPWGTYLTCEENWLLTVRGKLELQCDRSTRSRPSSRATASAPNAEGTQLPLEGTTSASTPGGIRTSPTASAGWSRSIPTTRTRCRSSAPLSGAASTRARPVPWANRGGWRSTWVTTRASSTSTSSSPTARGTRTSAANRNLLDDGMLYVARFNADGSGTWLPLMYGHGPLTPDRGFANQAEVAVKTRQAADAVGATRMDRPEWVVPHPVSGEVYAACTNNSARGRKGAKEGPNPANRRAPNRFGHIVRWREQGGDVAATRFAWDVFVEAGPADQGGTIRGDGFACPDGLWIDSMGTLWVGTDVSPTALGKGDFAQFGNNQLLAVDPATGVFSRFLTGPRGCEITAFHTTPDNRTAFVNVQHPGEAPGDRSNPDNPRAHSNWPDYDPAGRPRSATVVIRRTDGGIIGS